MTAQDLKNSILQLAVQGKLVPQNPSDEPASELLKRIRAEKVTACHAGIIKKDRKLPEIEETELPYDTPDTWEWLRLGQLCQLLDGVKMSGVKYPYLEAKYLRGKIEGTNIDSGKFVKKGTMLILVDGENSGEVFFASEDGYMGSTFNHDDKLWTIRSDVCDAGVVRRSGFDGLQGFCQRPGSNFDSTY